MGELTQQSRGAPRRADPAGGVKVAGPRQRQLAQLAAALSSAPPLGAGSAGTGPARLPERLRNGVETLSGIAMDDVRVHYDSARPAQLRAHAFAQGSDIHLAPGQAHHLPHEAWHVVQQAQGRVKPTAQLKGGTAINDDAALEREADSMGARALTVPAGESARREPSSLASGLVQAVIQKQDDDEEMNDPEGEILYRQLLSGNDLSDEDETMDPDYVQPDAVDESDLDDDGSVVMSDSDSDSTLPEMTLEERRKIDADALQRPFASSLLTAPNPLFKSRTTASMDKFKVGKVMGQRTQSAGPVTITLQSVALWVNGKREVRERPINVVGIVDPTVTKGRGGAPDPLSGYQVYSGEGQRPKASIASERNSGAFDVERGHVMALELGGPDLPENIVPQWAKFQGSGEWRKMEVSVLAKAKALKKGQQLRYAVDIFYKSSGEITPTLRTFSFPTGFKATTQVIEGTAEGPMTVEFHQGQAQDQTDQMLAERRMAKVDGPDWDPLLNREKPGGKKKREPITAVKKPDGAAVRKAAAEKLDGIRKDKRREALNKRRKQLLG